MIASLVGSVRVCIAGIGCVIAIVGTVGVAGVLDVVAGIRIVGIVGMVGTVRVAVVAGLVFADADDRALRRHAMIASCESSAFTRATST